MTSSRPARIEKAHVLLRPGIPRRESGLWADLGCGDGIFTTALCSLLGPAVEIWAVDKSQRALATVQRAFAHNFPDVVLHPLQADFCLPLGLPLLDGLVMANSLHFVREKAPVVRQIVGCLKPGGRLIVVEYNTHRGNTWVPFPLDEDGFLELAPEAGLREPLILNRIPSTFLGELYSGMGFR